MTKTKKQRKNEYLSYSEIQVSGTYILLDAKVGFDVYPSKEIYIINKHLSTIVSLDGGPPTYRECIIYRYLDTISTHFSRPFKDVKIIPLKTD